MEGKLEDLESLYGRDPGGWRVYMEGILKDLDSYMGGFLENLGSLEGREQL